jgi:murein DD-endopeptidase MepM/ murein hydrolase activator NlpD
MSSVRRRAVILIAALVLVGIALPRSSAPVRATGPDVNGAIADQQRMQQELDHQQNVLAGMLRDQASLQANLQSLADKVSSYGVQMDTAQQQIDTLAAALDQARSDLADANQQIALLGSNLGQVAVKIAANRVDLARQEALLQDHLRTVYEQSQTSVLEVILSSQSFGEVANQLTAFMTLSDDDQQIVDGIRALRQELAVRQEMLRNGNDTLAILQQEAAARAAALDAQQASLEQARASLEQQQQDLQQLQAAEAAQLATSVGDVAAYQQKIAKQEASVAGQQQLVDQLKAEANELDIAYHGRFAWPLHGPFVVTQEFGRTPYEYFHSGIDIAYLTPICGGPVYASADGVVLAAGRPNLAYGDTAIGVILGHSQRLQTWYWHLSREVVTVGQQVHAGDIIGYEGATGWATGCHLHFQVMLDGQPVNPRLYLP